MQLSRAEKDLWKYLQKTWDFDCSRVTEQLIEESIFRREVKLTCPDSSVFYYYLIRVKNKLKFTKSSPYRGIISNNEEVVIYRRDSMNRTDPTLIPYFNFYRLAEVIERIKSDNVVSHMLDNFWEFSRVSTKSTNDFSLATLSTSSGDEYQLVSCRIDIGGNFLDSRDQFVLSSQTKSCYAISVANGVVLIEALTCKNDVEFKHKLQEQVNLVISEMKHKADSSGILSDFVIQLCYDDSISLEAIETIKRFSALLKL